MAAARELRSRRRSLLLCSYRSGPVFPAERGPSCSSRVGRSSRIGLIGSGVFVTDPMGGFPPGPPSGDGSGGSNLAEATPTRAGKMHNACAIPIFAGIPLAGLASAVAAARSGHYCWACYSAASSTVMVSSFRTHGQGIRRRTTPLRKGRCLSAHLDRLRVRMAYFLSLRALLVPRCPQSFSQGIEGSCRHRGKHWIDGV
jgi:hypothetical protein